MADSGDLPRYLLDRLFDNLTDTPQWNVDDRNNVGMLRIITRETKTKFQLTIGVFSIAFVMSVIEKFTEFLNTLTMQYRLRYKSWINAVVMILSVLHFICTSKMFLITYLLCYYSHIPNSRTYTFIYFPKNRRPIRSYYLESIRLLDLWQIHPIRFLFGLCLLHW